MGSQRKSPNGIGPVLMGSLEALAGADKIKQSSGTQEEPRQLPPADQTPPVSKARIDACLRSAALWAEELPLYANRMQARADAWGLAAGIIATITGLSIFPIIGDGASDAQKVIVSFFAVAAGVCALVPRIKNYGEMAGQARELAAAYGPLVGRLMDASKVASAENASQAGSVRSAVTDFEAVKAKKDTLRYLARGRQLQDAKTRVDARVRELIA